MSKRKLIAAAMAGILVTILVPAGESCVLALAVEHACCTAELPAPAESCCAAADDPADSSRDGDAQLCDCAHPAATPAVAAAATAPRSGDHFAVDRDAPDHAHVPPARTIRVAADATSRPHPPSPAYLIGCSFLT
ncbi:MAG: hypothetical protein V2I67_10690 [Thermoanaerobaculales bacterium]|nr:hypothetical protein [Thermoanaerobaculales bacterium]